MQKNYKRFFTLAVPKFWLFTLIFLCFGFNTFTAAAQAILSGTVTNQNNETIPGVAVKIIGTQQGTITDINGYYTLNLAGGNYSLEFSFVGYEKINRTITLAANNPQVLNITLAEESKLMNEVVIVGYGTQRRRESVGSITKVDSKELKEVIGASFQTQLQGKAPGVNIIQNSGAAGAGALVRIRGNSSISAGGDPLYVVDGIPIVQDNFALGENNGANNNPLNAINPNDIESIDILKDASQIAIYGSRGANGVIIITTKSGKNTNGKPNFEYSSNIGLSKPTKIVELLNAQEWLAVRQEAWENDGNVGRAPLPLNLTYSDIEGNDTRWYDYIIGTGVKHEHNLGMNMGKKNWRFYLGGGYSDAGSYLKDNSFERISGRANAEVQISPKINLKFNTSLARGLNRRVHEAWAGGLGTAQTSALPIYPIYNEDGSYFNLYGNPIAQRELQKIRFREWKSINNINLIVSPTKNIDWLLSGNYEYAKIGSFMHEDSLWTSTYDISKQFERTTNNASAYSTLSYKLPFANTKHGLKIMGGVEYQSKSSSRFIQEYQDVDNYMFANYNTGSNFDTLTYDDRKDYGELFASLFGRINYQFNDRYFVQGVFRRDASSKFGSNKRFGNFPSIGAGWIISEEAFLKNNPVLNYLKLKASWGITGNSDIAWTEQFAIYVIDSLGGYNGKPLQYQSKLENPDLQWEEVHATDIGLEIGLWKDRVTADISWYRKMTTKGFISESLQASSGIDALESFRNVGKIRNRGIEIGLNTRNIVTPSFSWSTELNIAFNRNKVLEVGTAPPDALDGGFGDVRAVPGYPVTCNYIVRFSHVDPSTGRPVYLDKEGHETFVYDVVNNRVPIANQPDYLGGFTNTFRYKNFALSGLFTFSQGGYIYDDAAKRQLGVVTDWNMRREVLDHWTHEGQTNAPLPKLTMDMTNWGGNDNFWQNNHSLWLEDASYLRLKNVSLDYTFYPKNKKVLRSIVFRLSGTNLLTFTNYSGWDPEVGRGRENAQQRNIGGSNVTYLTPPQEKTYNIGININF